ncbi:MAG TPA: tRNA dihydrouridine synthase DusB [bacterium]|jgi:nifR3 family TIM-barrel protein
MLTPLRIGSVELPNRVIAAPMAGISDLPFRELAKRHGADLVCTEMVSAEALVRGTNGQTRRLMRYEEGERPISMQLFGGHPETMAEAARVLCDHGVDLIDINMGCPVKKIIKSGAGAALMREPARAAALVAAVVKAVDRPVTVKMRAGWDAASVNAPEVARACEGAGAAAVCVHARTRADGFGEVRDYELLRRVKAAVAVPVIGNGGVDSPEVAERLLADYGCDAVMVGRGALGNPWLFAAIRARLRREEHRGPTVEALRDTLLAHLARAVAVHGEGLAVRRLRKHLAWYLRGLRGAHRAKEKMQRLDGAAALEEAIRRYFDAVLGETSPAAV